MTQSHRGYPAMLLAVAVIMGTNGCQVPNRMYRLKTPIVEVPASQSLPIPAKPTHAEADCDMKQLLTRPCVAFLEFDEFGEAWEKTSSGRPKQLERVLDLIDNAKREDPQGQPLIVSFIHGWKDNAKGVGDPGGEDSKVVGLESAVNALHEVTWNGHVVIGIFISWRGDLVSQFWPVARQFTYWNREAAAIRVGNTSLTEALIEISDKAKESIVCSDTDACAASSSCPSEANHKAVTDLSQDKGSCTPLLVYVGHSMGALVLERALAQATVARMERDYNDAKTKHAESDRSGVAPAADSTSQTADTALPPSSKQIQVIPLADLVVYINSAAAATESKQLMDYLAFSGFVYRPTEKCRDGSADCGRDRPLFLAVTSAADSATGLFLKVGHALPLLGYTMNGSMRSNPPVAGQPDYTRACFDQTPVTREPKHRAPSDLNESDYYMSSTGHLAPLWSHTVVSKPATDNTLEEMHCKLGDPNSSTYATCRLGGIDYSVNINSGRCNGTPYWVMEIPKEIVPDHDTIFTLRLVTFLGAFVPRPEGENAYTRPRLTRPM